MKKALAILTLLCSFTLAFSQDETQTEKGATIKEPIESPAIDDEPMHDSQMIDHTTSQMQSSIAKAILSIVGVLVLILVTVWFLRRLANKRPLGMGNHRHIKILEKRLLSPKTSLYLIEVAGRQTLIAESMLDIEVLMSDPIHHRLPVGEIDR